VKLTVTTALWPDAVNALAFTVVVDSSSKLPVYSAEDGVGSLPSSV
jgi:hypothetical protein